MRAVGAILYLFPLILAGCVTANPITERVDSEHVAYMRKLDKPCRKVVNEQFKSGSFRTAHYLLSKPLGRLYQSYIVMVSSNNKSGRLIICENEMPKEPSVESVSGKRLAGFLADMKKRNTSFANSGIDFSPGSLSQGMYVRLEKGASGIKTLEYWLGVEMVKEVAPDFFSVFR